MADLSSLMDVAPLVGAAYIGQNQAQSQDTESIKQQELAQLISSRMQQQQFDAQKQPFELDKLRLGNVSTDLTNQKTGLDNDFTRATQASREDQTNAKNMSDAYTEVASHLGSMANAIDDNPNVPPIVAVSQALQDAGLPPAKTQALLQRYANVPPAQLKQRLQEDSDKVLRENPQSASAFDTASLHTSAQIMMERMRGENQLNNTEAQIAGGRYSKQGLALDLNQALLKYGHTATATAEIYDRGAQIAENSGDHAEAQRLTLLAQAARKRAAEDAANRGNNKPGIDLSAESGLPPSQGPTATAPIGAPPRAAPNPNAGTPGKDFFPGIPQGAVEKLRQTPGLAKAFDDKYGAGASAAVLRGYSGDGAVPGDSGAR